MDASFWKEQDFKEKVHKALALCLAKRGLQIGLPPLHPRNPPPSVTVRRSSCAPVQGYAHMSPSPMEDITEQYTCYEGPAAGVSRDDVYIPLEKQNVSPCECSWESLYSERGQDPLDVRSFEKRVEEAVTCALANIGVELHPRNPLPSGSNSSSVQGMDSSFSQKQTQLLDGTKDHRESSGSPHNCASHRDSALANTTDNDDKVADVCSQTVPEQQAKKKRRRKKRRPNQLRNDVQVVTRVNNKGSPVSPVKVASGYSNTVGVIVREFLPITCTDLMAEEHNDLRALMLQMLYNRYEFEIEVGEDVMKRVKQRAQCMMAKALVMWRNSAKKKYRT